MGAVVARTGSALTRAVFADRSDLRTVQPVMGSSVAALHPVCSDILGPWIERPGANQGDMGRPARVTGRTPGTAQIRKLRAGDV